MEYQLDRDHEIIDFAEAVLIAQQLPPGHRRRELVERIARRWAREDPQAAIEWASSLTGEERIHAMERAIESWADEDALAALEFVAALPNSERSLDWVHHGTSFYTSERYLLDGDDLFRVPLPDTARVHTLFDRDWRRPSTPEASRTPRSTW